MEGQRVSLGKVAFTYAGDFSPEKTYRKFDWVSDLAGSYASLKENNKGHSLTDRSWWAPLSDSKATNEAREAASAAADRANEAASNLETIKTETKNATVAANTAAGKASSAAERAGTEADRASDAATKATAAKDKADLAAIGANAAKDEAVAATEKTNQATQQANAATDKANAASVKADKSATDAGVAATEARNATGLVTTAVAECNAATAEAKIAARETNQIKADAVSATTKANEAATSATQAATSAGQAADKANKAAADAANYGDRVTELEDAVFPYSLSVSGGGVFEKGTTQTINVSWVMKKGGSVVTPDSSKVNGEPATGTSKQFAGVTTTTTYNVEATKAGKTKTGSTTVVFVAASYCGVVAHDFTASESSIKALSKTVKNTKGYTISGQTVNNQKMCYAYPKSLGALTSIKDANNFDYINSYVRSEMQVNGETYYVYVLKDATSVSGFKQVYS